MSKVSKELLEQSEQALKAAQEAERAKQFQETFGKVFDRLDKNINQTISLLEKLKQK